MQRQFATAPCSSRRPPVRCPPLRPGRRVRHCPRGPAGGFPLLPSLLWFLPCYCLGGETEGGSRHHLLATDSLKPQHLGQHLLVLLQRCGAGDLFPRHGDRQTGWRWWGGKKRSRRASTTWWETVRPQRVRTPQRRRRRGGQHWGASTHGPTVGQDRCQPRPTGSGGVKFCEAVDSGTGLG